MNHYVFKAKDSYKICFLVNRINLEEIKKEYLNQLDVLEEDILLLDLYKDPKKKKTSVSDMKEYLKDVEETLAEFNVEYVVVCNSDYFKVFAKEAKADVHIGYIKNVDNRKVIYMPDFKSIFYDPIKVREKITRSIKAINNDLNGTYQEPGTFHYNAKLLTDPKEIDRALAALIIKPVLTCDIETFSLRPHEAGIATIGFAWDEENGIAFAVDSSPENKNLEVRSCLLAFFMFYQGKLIFHNIAFDASVLIYQLFMDDITDTKGLLDGLKYLLRDFEDTKIIAYLATNSCAGNELGLKALAHEFAGNYAQEEINDVTKIPLEQLLDYNVVDCLSTWFVYNKYYPKMLEDNQENIYETLFKPSLVDIVQMQLTGFPLNMERVLEVEQILQNDLDNAVSTLKDNNLVKNYVHILKEKWVEDRNKKLKKKQVTIDDAKVEFNPRSHLQLQELFYSVLQLPVINKTDNGLPSTDSDTFKALLNHTDNEEVKSILQALIDFSAVDKILTAFIPTFKDAVYSKEQNWHYLIGNFNLGGTVSGRLSSSKPNLQQLPATGSKYAKVIKSCFQAPKGWLLCGLDFNALEDHISALLTKDSNKLKVYLDGYDSHSIRAYNYFKDQMPDITAEIEKEPEKEIEIINSIKTRYTSLRSASKAPTFALTYAGTWTTLVKNCGFTAEEAKKIEATYHELYKESDEFVAKKMSEAARKGYVEVAFGLRVRTPVMHQCILGLRNTPKEAEAEKRTAGNALGQSYGLLNNRAGVEFNTKVRKSDYNLSIKPVAQIHDAQYFLVKDDEDVLLWANEHLVKAVSWQEDPNIYHPDVKLGGEFSVFWPDWSKECVIPNIITKSELTTLVYNYVNELRKNK